MDLLMIRYDVYSLQISRKKKDKGKKDTEHPPNPWTGRTNDDEIELNLSQQKHTYIYIYK